MPARENSKAWSVIYAVAYRRELRACPCFWGLERRCALRAHLAIWASIRVARQEHAVARQREIVQKLKDVLGVHRGRGRA